MKSLYYSMLFKLLSVFTPCSHKLDHPWYLKVLRAKTKHDLALKYDIPEYNKLFDKFWSYAISSSGPKVTHALFQLRLNLQYMDSISLRTMCGIQSMYGPVWVAKKLVTDGSTTLTQREGAVQAGSRKLSAMMSKESVDDIGSDFSELSDGMIKAVVTQIDLEYMAEFCDIIKRNAPQYGIDLSVDFAEYNSASETGSELIRTINQMADDIMDTTWVRGNVAWVSPYALTVLQVAGRSKFLNVVPPMDKEVDTLSTENATLCGVIPNDHGHNIKVYCTPFALTDDIIVGYRKADDDAGMILLPYMPVMSTGVIMNPVTHQPTVAFMTRYAWWSGDGLEDVDVDAKEEPKLTGYAYLNVTGGIK